MQPSQDTLLMLTVAEQIKQSLQHITMMAESSTRQSDDIALVSQHSLRLLDAYTLATNQTELPLEPLTTAAVIYDAAQIIDPIAKQFGFTVNVDLHGTSRPVMTHRQTLKDLLVLLATGVMQVGSSNGQGSLELVLGTHRVKNGTVVGAFSPDFSASQAALRMSRRLRGIAFQPAPELSLAGGATLAVADHLSMQLRAPLKTYRHTALNGIGSLLAPSNQLKFVV